MTNTKLLNVTVFSNHASYIYGLAVGGICGKAINASFDNVKLSNIEIIAKDQTSTYSEDESYAGIAGGLCAYACNSSTFNNCSINGVIVVSGNGVNASGTKTNSYDGCKGGDAGAVGGACAVANSSTFNNFTATNCQIVSGDAGNGSKGTSSSDSYQGQSNWQSMIGVGGDGGDCFIGGVVGLGQTSVSINSNKITYSSTSSGNTYSNSSVSHAMFKTKGTVEGSLVTSFTRLQTGSVCAGTGGTGGTGLKGKDHGEPAIIAGWWDDPWLSTDDCPRIKEGKPGGAGGNGGHTFVGQVTGRVSFDADFVQGGTTTDSINCSVGGAGGNGGRGGDGATWTLFKHRAKSGGAGGAGGLNGNNDATNRGSGEAGHGRSGDTTGGAGGAGGAGATSENCYLQS